MNADAPAPPARPRHAARRWIRRALALLATAGVAVLLVLAWWPQPVPADAVAIRRGALRVTLDEDGRTRLRDHYRVSAPLAGHCARIELHAGDAVRRGDVLARLLPAAPALLDARSRAEAEARSEGAAAMERQARASIERARIALGLAQGERERQRQLVERGATTAQAVERAEAEVHGRAAELASAEFAARVAARDHEMALAALGRFERGAPEGEQLEVTAPVDGVVLRVLAESGGFVGPGTPLLEIGDPTALEVAVDVLTADAVRIPAGAAVQLDRWGGDGPLRAHVRRVEPSAFTRTSALGVEEQRVDVLVDLDEPRERWMALGDGFRVEAHIVIWEAEDVTLVPELALFRGRQGWAVYAMRDGRAREVEVEVGHRSGIDAEVISGLREGDLVVVHPSDRVADGVALELRGR